jgi:hypothetical protein
LTYPTPAPANYDDAAKKIDVDPGQIELDAIGIDGVTTVIVGHMNTIATTWQGLKLGWAGQTKAEVDSFNTDWLNATTAMFGEMFEKDNKTIPGEGHSALGKVRMLIMLAAANYANAEHGVSAAFLHWGEVLSGADTNTADQDKNWKAPDTLPTDIPKGDPPKKPDNTGQLKVDDGRNETEAPVTEVKPA